LYSWNQAIYSRTDRTKTNLKEIMAIEEGPLFESQVPVMYQSIDFHPEGIQNFSLNVEGDCLQLLQQLTTENDELRCKNQQLIEHNHQLQQTISYLCNIIHTQSLNNLQTIQPLMKTNFGFPNVFLPSTNNSSRGNITNADLKLNSFKIEILDKKMQKVSENQFPLDSIFFANLHHINPFKILVKGCILDPKEPTIPVRIEGTIIDNERGFKYLFVTKKEFVWNFSENRGNILICFTAVSNTQTILLVKMLSVML